MTKKHRTEKRIRTIESWVTVGFFGILFLAMSIFFLMYVGNNHEELISNSYNSRQQLLAKENTRGKIIDSKGNVLAQTKISESGKEYRDYPYAELFAHAVGFSTKGKTGIEDMANYYLINSDISLEKKAVNEMEGKKNPGNDVYTSLDYDLQKVASDALGVCKGAIIVSDVRTGDILAMVSKPDFDPNSVASDWDKYVNDNSQTVLLNRATQGLYPPGSTFKILTTLEYIRENPDNYMDYSYTCNGSYRKDDIKINCFHGSVHNGVDLKKSFAKSCNSSFANIGMTLDRQKYGETLNEMLFNSNLPLDYNYSVSNLKVDSGTSDDDMSQIAIGQGHAQITPIQLNMITNAIANKGILMKPKVLDHVESADGSTVKTYEPEEYARLMSEEESAALTELMKAVVSEGTATKLISDNYTAAGKTGSAEFNHVAADSHAWFTGFVPADNPEISVTIIVESIGSGGEYAVPIAKRIIDAYYGVY